MNDPYAIADKIEAAGYLFGATIIRQSASQTVERIMHSLKVISQDDTIPQEVKRDIADFAFNQRSYR